MKKGEIESLVRQYQERYGGTVEEAKERLFNDYIKAKTNGVVAARRRRKPRLRVIRGGRDEREH